MDFEPLHIHDSDERTEGGAPGWIVWAVILVSVTTIVVTALVFGMLLI